MAEYTRSEVSAASDGASITAAGTDLTRPARALYVGTTGTVTVRFLNGDNSDVSFPNVPAGTVLPIMVKRVSVGTDIVALYE